MSLYRDYRPLSFDDVVGQRHVVETLERSVAQGKTSHAYLFAGSRGTGKTSVARILAKSLLTQGIDDESLKKLIVKAAEEGNLVDLTEIDAASNRGIDDIRSLVEKIQFSPAVSKAKVYIIDEVHMLTKEAFNALLKTLEEPPPYAYFILATTELHKIPATIQSRCQRFLFRQVREDDIVGRLKYVAEKEGIKADDDALKTIAHAVQGGMRDAISLLDQLRSLPHIRLQDVKERIGETGHEHAETMRNALAANDHDEVLRIIRTLEETAIPFDSFVRLMLAMVRADLHLAIDEKRETRQLIATLDNLLETLKDLRLSPVPAMTLEARLLELCLAPSSEEKPTARPAAAPKAAHPAPKPEVAATKQEEAPPAPKPAPAAVESKPVVDVTPDPVSPAPVAKEAPPALVGDLDIKAIKVAWPSIVKDMEPAFVRMSLKNAGIHALEGATLVLAFASGFHRDKVKTPDALRTLEELIDKHVGHKLRVRCELEADLHTHPLPVSEAVNLAEAAAEIF